MTHILSLMDEPIQAGPRSSALFKASGRERTESTVPRASAKSRAGFAEGTMKQLSGEEVRMDRVTELRAAIATGSYKVSASDLADKILHSMLKK